jgi:D-methionine transport system ATP-binding protein
MSSLEPLLQIDLLNKSFKQGKSVEKILSDLSLTIHKGSIVGVIGRSGAGKSTFLRCLNGLEKPDTGQILFDGQNLCELSSVELRQIRQKIGFIFQSYNLLQSKNVFDNIGLPLMLAGQNKTQIRQRVEYVAELVGLSHKLSSYPHQLSGGQCQRVSIARALVIEAKLLLCDEFTSALDPQTVIDILDLLQTLQQKLGLTIVFVTHDMNVVKHLAHYVYVLDHGCLVEQGTPIQIMTQAQHPATCALLTEFLKAQLPEFIKSKLHSVPHDNDDIILRLTFHNQSSTKPLISTLAQQGHLAINIIGGNLHHSGDQTFGHLLVSLKYDEDTFPTAVNFLQANSIHIEQMGYLQWSS